MLIRRLAIATVALLATLLLVGPALAQNTKSFAVLPFSYNGPDKYKYFPSAFQASLNSDLEWVGHVEPAGDSAVEGLGTPSGKGAAINAMRSANIDYLITGTITILNKEATLSMSAVGVDGASWDKKGQMPIDEITPWLDEQSKAIMGDVFHRPGYGASEEVAKQKDLEDRVSTPTNSAFLMAAGNQGQGATLNPQFRYEGGSQSIGRWRSQTLRFSSTSMVIADGDGDGQKEVFILHKTGLSAYRYKDGKLDHLDTISLTPNTTYIRLEMADINKDKVPELIVASYQTYYRSELLAPEGYPKSHILSFKSGKFEFLLKGYGKFLGVLRMPPSFMPVMVMQRKGTRHLFDKKIREAFLINGSIETGQRIAAPEFGNIYNMAYLPDEFAYRYAVLDDERRLKMYSQTMERLSSSDQDKYNSSGIGIDASDRMDGMGPGASDIIFTTYNIPFRMIPAPLGAKKQYQLLVNKDLSVAAEVFERFTYYSQGEIHALAWDGVGMNLAWKTRRIKGQVSDIALADLNNDGKKQLVVLLNTFPGGMGFTKRKTIVLAYDLNQ